MAASQAVGDRAIEPWVADALVGGVDDVVGSAQLARVSIEGSLAVSQHRPVAIVGETPSILQVVAERAQ